MAEVLGEMRNASVTSRQAEILAEIARCRRAACAPRPRACDVPSQTQSELSHFFFAGAGNLNLPKETAKTAKRVKPSWMVGLNLTGTNLWC